MPSGAWTSKATPESLVVQLAARTIHGVPAATEKVALAGIASEASMALATVATEAFDARAARVALVPAAA